MAAVCRIIQPEAALSLSDKLQILMRRCWCPKFFKEYPHVHALGRDCFCG